jgi:outer membrane receptor for ferrienterochelin and colicin
LLQGTDGRLGLTLGSSWRAYDEPGALLDSILAKDRRASDELFRFDHTKDQTHTLTLDGQRRAGRARISGNATGEYRAFDAIRTIALAPGFGDTKERDSKATRGGAGLQAEIDDSPLPGRDRLTLGAEGSYGALDSKYYKVLTAPRATYRTAPGTRGALDTDGSSHRDAIAAYADYSVHPVSALRVSLGGRVDRLHDVFDPKVPAGGTSSSTTHSAFSPKGGLNFQYQDAPGQSGHAYVAVSKSFKAPTLDQLYDQRRLPVNFPPFQITTSNRLLQPQYGTSVEGGLYQEATLWAGGRLSASISGYQIEMRDELDFDVQTLKYVNIGQSRHRGVELGANIEGAQASAFAAYTLQAATSQSGSSSGMRLKAIPRHTLNGGFTVTPTPMFDASVLATHVRDTYLDDANTITLPAYTRVDLRFGVKVAGRSIFAEARNILDASYSQTGFQDPAGSGKLYFYPAAGRTLSLGVRSGY